ncbi:MAG: hypothetical protein KBG47_00165 [Bacteroidia bacterium]|jgi:hypothetical protein|nr:hypothetical protein [Bacteroidia bacterium]
MRYLLAISLFVFINSCKESADIIHQKLFTFTDQAGVKEDTSHAGHYYFRHDSIHNIAFIDTVRFTEAQLGKKLTLEYKGKIRTDYVHSFASIKIVLFRDHEPIHWTTIPLRELVVDLNKWNKFRGYYVLPYHQQDRPYNKAMLFTELAEGKKENFDIDSVDLTIKCIPK